MADHLWLGQFNIVRGEVREEGPFVGVFDAPPDAERPADLFVLTEPALPGSESYCDQLVAVLGQLFHSTDLSITGSLQRALRSAHDSLRDWNRKSLPEHWIAAGAACLAVAGAEGYAATVGPCAVFVRRGDEVRRLEPLSPASLEPLGASEQFSPYFARVVLGPGDVALLASSSVGRLADEAMMAALLSLPPEDILRELYLLARREENFAALVVARRLPAAGEEEAGPPAAAAATAGAAVAPEPPAEAPPPPPEETAAPEPSRAEAREETAEEEAVEAAAPPAADTGAAAAPPAPSVDPGAFRARLPDPRRRPERPTVDIQEREHAAGAPSPAAPSGSWQAGRSRAPARPYPSLGSRRLRLPFRAIFIAAAALGLLALTWLALPGLLAESQADRYETLVRRAEAAYSSAQTEEDADDRRRLLVQADADLQEARHLAPDRPEAAALAEQVRQALQELDARTTLENLSRIADLSTSGVGPQAVTRVVLGDQVYALDTAEGKVLAVPRNGGAQPRVVFEAGRRVDGVETGRAALAAWVPGNSPYLLILDQNKRAFGLRGDQLRALTVRGSGQWQDPRAMKVSGGTLYVLDAGAGEIRRFTPTDNGFDSAPQVVVSGADLRRAVDLAVGTDLFVLGQDGALRRFAGGAEVEFRLAGVDPPLASPVSLALATGNGHLYVADSGNQRIVVAGQDGRFRQQLVSTQLTTINAMAVDGQGGLLVVAVGQSLYAGPLPEAPS
ncbi:MAG TPA: hypothetical protein VIO14_05085 [Dehalococcoidia bacterium]